MKNADVIRYMQAHRRALRFMILKSLGVAFFTSLLMIVVGAAFFNAVMAANLPVLAYACASLQAVIMVAMWVYISLNCWQRLRG